MKSPIIRVGGKFYMLKHLLKLIPEHDVYVEVFGGAGHLLFAKQPSKIEYFNDIDLNVVTFFRVLRDKDKFEEFYRLISLTPYSRYELDNAINKLKENNLSDVERAYCFFIAIEQSFGGLMDRGFGYCLNYRRNSALSYLNTISRLPEITNRLLNVFIENKDFRKLIPVFNDKHIFLYLDPPYYPDARKDNNFYDHEMSIDDHKELIELVMQSKSKILLSGYDNELYKILEKNGWERHDYKSYLYFRNNTGSANLDPRIETVWFNYKLNKLF